MQRLNTLLLLLIYIGLQHLNINILALIICGHLWRLPDIIWILTRSFLWSMEVGRPFEINLFKFATVCLAKSIILHEYVSDWTIVWTVVSNYLVNVLLMYYMVIKNLDALLSGKTRPMMLSCRPVSKDSMAVPLVSWLLRSPLFFWWIWTSKFWLMSIIVSLTITWGNLPLLSNDLFHQIFILIIYKN